MSVWDSLPKSRSVDGIRARIAAGTGTRSWLLAGGRGSPQMDVAVAMAAAFVCREEPGRGCGHCSHCRRVLKKGHPDVHHIVPEGAFIRVESIRDSVIPEVSRSPFEAAMKVFVIEEADRMNPSAQNALLKTLEEAPADAVLILVTERDEELLETIKSRCLVVRFQPVPAPVLVSLLEREGAPPELAALAVRVAADDIGRARELALDESARLRRSQWLSIPGRLWTPADAVDLAAEVVGEVREAVRIREQTHKAEIAEILETFADARGTAAVKTALTARYKRRLKRIEETLVVQAFETMSSFYRDVLALKLGDASCLLNTDRRDQIAEWAHADTTHPAGLTSMIERCGAAAAALTKNANVTLTLESLLLDALRLVPPPGNLAA